MKVTNAKEMLDVTISERKHAIEFVKWLLKTEKIIHVKGEISDEFDFNINIGWYEDFIKEIIKDDIHK